MGCEKQTLTPTTHWGDCATKKAQRENRQTARAQEEKKAQKECGPPHEGEARTQ